MRVRHFSTKKTKYLYSYLFIDLFHIGWAIAGAVLISNYSVAPFDILAYHNSEKENSNMSFDEMVKT